jgi:hypothetical protein
MAEREEKKSVERENNRVVERIGRTEESIGPFGGPQGKPFGAKNAPQDDKRDEVSLD